MVNISLPNMQILAEMLQRGKWYYIFMKIEGDYLPIGDHFILYPEHVLIDVEKYKEMYGIHPAEDNDNVEERARFEGECPSIQDEDLNHCVDYMRSLTRE